MTKTRGRKGHAKPNLLVESVAEAQQLAEELAREVPCEAVTKLLAALGQASEAAADHVRVIQRMAPLAAIGAQQAASRTPPPKFVYYAQLGGYIKIGSSHDPPTRVKQIHNQGMWWPADLPRVPPRLVVTEPGSRLLELERHRQFAEFRVVGEWFRINVPLLTHMAAIREKRSASSVSDAA